MAFWRSFSIFGAIAFVLVLIELPLELRAYHRGYQTFLFGWKGLTPTPPSADGRVRDFGPTKTFPFWSEVVPEALAEGETRFWITSASHAAETHLPLDLIFPVVLSDLCRERGHRCQVLSASAPGFTTTQSAEQIELHAARFPAKAVVLYQMANDVVQLARLSFNGAPLEDSASAPVGAPKAEDAKALVSPRILTNQLVDSMSSQQLLKTNLTNRVVAQRILHAALPDEAIRVFRSRVRTFIQTAKRHRIQPILATFATSHRSDQIASFPEAHRLKLFAFSRELSMEGWARTVDLLNEELRALAREEDIPLIDVAATMAGRHELFRDFYHFTPDGHREVARVLADALIGAP